MAVTAEGGWDNGDWKWRGSKLVALAEPDDEEDEEPGNRGRNGDDRHYPKTTHTGFQFFLEPEFEEPEKW